MVKNMIEVVEVTIDFDIYFPNQLLVMQLMEIINRRR